MRNIACFALAFIFLGHLPNAQCQPAEMHWKVGMILPLSGPAAEFGIAVENGIALAQKDHAKALSDVQFLYQDSKWEGPTAISAFEKLVNFDHCNIIFVWGWAPAGAVAPLTERRKIPLFAISPVRDL